MTATILIVGGTGIIGGTIKKILIQRNPNLKIYIGSRKKRELNNSIQLNVDDNNSFQALKNYTIDLIVVCTKDTNNHVLKYAIENSIDYIDVTKPSNELKKAIALTHQLPINSKIVFSSGWMGGIAPIFIFNTTSFDEIEKAKIIVYYSAKDIAGNSSADFMAENCDKIFNYYDNNLPVTTKHFRNVERHTFAFDNNSRKIFDFDIPDLYILNQVEKISSVHSKITFNSSFITNTLIFMQRLNIFNILSFKYKKMIFGGSGSGDISYFDIELETKNKEKKKISIKSTKGQAELTSFSTVLHIEQILIGLHHNGVYFAHQLYNSPDFEKLLTQNQDISIN